MVHKFQRFHKFQKKKNCWFVLVLCLCIFCSSQAQAGAIQDKIDSTGNKINELENALDKTEGDISVYEREQKALEQDIAKGQEKISRLSAELDETQDAIGETQDEIAKTQKELGQSQADSKEQYEHMRLRIRFMYENSLSSMLNFVLEAGSLSEALRRADYFQAVVSYDREKLQEYKATIRKIKKEKKQLVAEEEELETLEKKQSAKLAEIDAAVEELKDRLGDKLAQIENSKVLREKYLEELEQQKEYEKELERQKAEEDRRRQEEIRRQEEELERQRKEQQRQNQQNQQQNQQGQQQNSNSGSGSTDARHGNSSSTASASDLELLSTIIYCEAGNQPYEGQLAVGSVVMNRVASRSFPNSISGVIYQSGQFSPVASGRFAQALAAGSGARCRAVAQDVLNGRRNVDCLYFRVDNGLIDGIVIGSHVFY